MILDLFSLLKISELIKNRKESESYEPWSKVFHFGNPIILAYGKAYAILTFSNVLLTFLL